MGAPDAHTRGRSVARALAWGLAVSVLSSGLTRTAGAEPPEPRFQGVIEARVVGEGFKGPEIEIRVPDNRRGNALLAEAFGAALAERGFIGAAGADRVLTFEFKRDVSFDDRSPSIVLRGSGGSSSTPRVGARVKLPFRPWGEDDAAGAKPRSYLLTAEVGDSDGTIYWRGSVTLVTDAEDEEVIRRRMAAYLGAHVGADVIGKPFDE